MLASWKLTPLTTLDDHVLIDSCAGNADLADAFKRLALIRRSVHVGTTRGRTFGKAT
jgi:hypothetical protein